MAESPCLCGCTTVRKGSRFIGRLQFWCGLISAFFFIVFLLILIVTVAGGHFEEFKKHLQNQNQNMKNFESAPIIILFVYGLASIVTMIYTGNILIKATLNHNLQYVKTWLKINGIILIIGTVINIMSIIIIPKSDSIVELFLGFFLSAYMWTTVYQFYKDEKPSAF